MTGRRPLATNYAGERRQTGRRGDTLPEPPGFLTDRAKEIFRETAGRLDAVNVLAETDAGVLARYAAVLDRWEQAEAALAASGPIHYARLVNRAGDPASAVALPAMMQAAKSHDQLRQLETVLGLTPADRTRLPSSPAADTDDPAERMFRAVEDEKRRREATGEGT
jgi:P27 family predicted phage terminase small subunit